MSESTPFDKLRLGFVGALPERAGEEPESGSTVDVHEADVQIPKTTEVGSVISSHRRGVFYIRPGGVLIHDNTNAISGINVTRHDELVLIDLDPSFPCASTTEAPASEAA